MKLKRVRRAALVVAVISAVGVIAATAGASPGTPGDAALTGGPAIGASANITGASGPSDTSGASGASAAIGASGATGTSGDTGATGTTEPTQPTTPSEPAGSSTPTQTAPDTAVQGATSATGDTGATGSTTPVEGVGVPPDLGAVGYGSGHRRRHRKHHHHGTSGTSPIVIAGSQPRSASGTGSPGGYVVTGPSAPPPSLFAGANPLAGVLPGSWEDPFIVAGAADVPQFYVDSFHVPPFLLSIYQAAGAAYDIPWQTLAAINEVETDYGTNLDVSSAGAIGWMQFLPSTWRRYGLDASASGSRDPYNAADAIFSAAKYLAAAGGAHNLPAAIFAYNHSHAYVKSVLDRAELLSGEPAALVGSVTELAEGDFPIQLRYHATYRPAGASATGAPRDHSSAASTATAPLPGAVGAAAAAGVHSTPGAAIYAESGAAVVSAQDGTVVAIGHNHKLGRYIVVRNAFGDRFTYANLASVSAWHPSPKPAQRSAQILSAAVPSGLAQGPRPTAPASAGGQSSGKSFASAFTTSKPHKSKRAKTASVAAAPVLATINLSSTPSASTLFTPVGVLERDLRGPRRAPRVVHRAALLARYFTGAFGLRPSQLELTPLRLGSHVLAGTILGRLARSHGKRQPHLLFQLRPAGSNQAAINPLPFLDAWSQLETLELHRDSFGPAPYFGPNLHARSVGGLLVASQVDLERIVLQDPHVSMPACESAAIAAGNVDRRVLTTLEVLVLHGIDPVVSGTWCSHDVHTRRATPGVLKTPNAIALVTLDGRAATGAVAHVAAEALAKLPRADRPAVSTTTFADHLVIAFAPAREQQTLAVAASYTAGFALSSQRWSQLDSRLGQIAEPRVPTAVSHAALPVRKHRSHSHS
ncbi:MAG TPA: lytic murein transglycosylase [Solirubrobacteraceae bacterium]|jgi:murein DD-endopeptidase MepM/ murein hydrolase activator NlpD